MSEVPEKSRGRTVMRRSQFQSSTTDQRLLDSRGPTDWVHTDPWRVLRIQSEFVEGFGALAELGPAISVFGSARTTPEDPMYQAAEQLGRALTEAGFAVITGGGPGIMEAANKGACESGGVSVGLGIELPFESGLNRYVDIVKYAQGFVVLPGGFGTFDELFEALTLVQTQKVTSFPIILVGRDYWSGLVDWIKATVLADKKIAENDLDMFRLTDDIHEAVEILVEAQQRRRSTAPGGGEMHPDAERPD